MVCLKNDEKAMSRQVVLILSMQLPGKFLNYNYMSSSCRGSDSASLKWGMNICIYKLPDGTDSAGPGTMRSEKRIEGIK